MCSRAASWTYAGSSRGSWTRPNWALARTPKPTVSTKTRRSGRGRQRNDARRRVFDLGGGVPRVDDHIRVVDNELIIDRAVVGDDKDSVGPLELRRRQGNAHPLVPFLAEARNEWVVVRDGCPAAFEQANDIEGRAFANVIDILLVRHPDDEDATAIDRLARVIERVGGFFDDVVGHLAVDLARQIDKARLVVERA